MIKLLLREKRTLSNQFRPESYHSPSMVQEYKKWVPEGRLPESLLRACPIARICIHISVCVCVFVCDMWVLCMYLVYVSISLCIYIAMFLYICVYVMFLYLYFVFMCLFPFVCVCVDICIYVSIHPSVHPSISSWLCISFLKNTKDALGRSQRPHPIASLRPRCHCAQGVTQAW